MKNGVVSAGAKGAANSSLDRDEPPFGYDEPPFDCDEMAGKINRLIEDPSLRERFARQALVSLGEFETTRVIGQWKRLLAELADGTR